MEGKEGREGEGKGKEEGGEESPMKKMTNPALIQIQEPNGLFD